MLLKPSIFNFDSVTYRDVPRSRFTDDVAKSHIAASMGQDKVEVRYYVSIQ